MDTSQLRVINAFPGNVSFELGNVSDPTAINGSMINYGEVRVNQFLQT